MSASRKTNIQLPDTLLHSIGHVAALWARLEHEIDGMIRQCLDAPGAPEIDTALILPFRKRIELLADLLPRHAPDSDHVGWISEFVAIVKHLHHQRDMIIHGSVSGSGQRRKRKRVYWFRRVRWDRPPRILEKRAMTVAQVEAIAAEISDQIAVSGALDVMLWAALKASRGKGA